MENLEQENVSSRRAFLKKAAYAAPMVVTLGALTAPATAGASVFTQNFYKAGSNEVSEVREIITEDGTNNVIEGKYYTVPEGQVGGSSETYSGATVKEAADVPTEQWGWANDVFGGSDKWNGL